MFYFRIFRRAFYISIISKNGFKRQVLSRGKAPFRISITSGVTFVEVMITLVMVMIASMGTVGAIVYSRANMELEKQRVAALNYCRQSMESIQCLDDAYASTKSLVPFNAPGVENLDANVSVEYYKLKTDGSVDWTTSMTAPALDVPVYARVAVTWIPYGRNDRPQEVCMSTILTRGID